jgi:uncharacterized small protein (TIGR04563 family)
MMVSPGSSTARAVLKPAFSTRKGAQVVPEIKDKKIILTNDDRSPSTATDKRKQSLYFPEEMLAEIKHEAIRLDRSLSWIVQQAWRKGKDEIKKFPSINIEEDD